MKKAYDAIPPHKEDLIIGLVCTIGSAILASTGYDGNLPITPSPKILFVFSLIALIFSTRTVKFSHQAIKIRYFLFLFGRNISWERVKGVEFVRQHIYEYIFIYLDDCPFFEEGNKSIRNFTYIHPIKLIAIPIPQSKKIQYAEMLEKYYSSIRFTDVAKKN